MSDPSVPARLSSDPLVIATQVLGCLAVMKKPVNPVLGILAKAVVDLSAQRQQHWTEGTPCPTCGCGTRCDFPSAAQETITLLREDLQCAQRLSDEHEAAESQAIKQLQEIRAQQKEDYERAEAAEARFTALVSQLRALEADWRMQMGIIRDRHPDAHDVFTLSGLTWCQKQLSAFLAAK